MTNPHSQPRHQQLYARQDESRNLQRAFRRCTLWGQSQAELVLITGSSGSGKTILAQTAIQDCIRPTGGLFLQAKFDPRLEQAGEETNYFPVLQAVSDLVEELLALTADDISHWSCKNTDNGVCRMVYGSKSNSRLDVAMAVLRDLKRALLELRDTDGFLLDRIPALYRVVEWKDPEALTEENLKQIEMTESQAEAGEGKEKTLLPGPRRMAFVEQLIATVAADTQKVASLAPPVPAAAVVGTERRLQDALARLLKRVSSNSRPCVLLLDDIQWAEPASLELLHSLVARASCDHEQQGGFMLLTTCRSNQVSSNSHLSVTLRELEADQVAITDIQVQNLDVAAVANLTQETLLQVKGSNSCDRKETLSEKKDDVDLDDFLDTAQLDRLAALVHQQTSGNPFFVVQLLQSIIFEGFQASGKSKGKLSVARDGADSQSALFDMLQHMILDHSPDMQEHPDHFEDDESIGEQKASMNNNKVKSLLAHKVQSLPVYCQNVLKVAACLGSRFDVSLLRHVSLLSRSQENPAAAATLKDLDEESIVTASCHNDDNADDDSTESVTKALRLAEEKGLVASAVKGNWRFVHDQIRAAVFSLIDVEDLPAIHLQVGRDLAPIFLGTSHDSLVVNQLRLGAHLIVDQGDRHHMAGLLLNAAEKAATSSAFASAASYLNLGISLLGKDRWRDQYRLSLNLYSAAAEVEYCNANFDQVDEHVEEVIKHARVEMHKTRARTTRIYSLGSRGRLEAATRLGFSVLDSLGEAMPGKASTMKIIIELGKTKRMLKKLSDYGILHLPFMRDERKLAAMRIMCIMLAHTTFSQPAMAPLIAMRMIKLTIQHGLSGMASVGFSAHGMFCCVGFGDIQGGMRYARLSLDIMKMFNAKEWLARVHVNVYGFSFSCTEPWRNALKPLLVAHRVGLGTGDIEFSMLTACMYAANAFDSSMNLKRLATDIDVFLGLMRLHKQTNALQFLRPQAQLVFNLIGTNQLSHTLDGKAITEQEAMDEAIATKNCTGLALILHLKLKLCCYCQEFRTAEQAAIQLFKCKSGRQGFAWNSCASMYLHAGLAAAAMCALTGKKTWRRMRMARKCIQMLKSYARYAPENHVNKIALLEAEISACKGREREAMLKFDESISLAAKEDLWHEMALACERAAEALRFNGKIDRAREYLYRSVSAYAEWGATAKVLALRRDPLFGPGFDSSKILRIEACSSTISSVSSREQKSGNTVFVSASVHAGF